ncbi:uncharacterized protein LOC119117041 isoform X5 [Syngnathus acus]|uniref:uncharacterized protein LOC119117041 isoform X5 n=1 Tax=Syngnathus acus TaxID=161584 RepID=UPI0018861455|nr:uncharacterized protein LOC119117041 isoform X5 [Syngnathus acus]
MRRELRELERDTFGTSGEHPRPREPVGQPVAWRARAGKRLSLRRLWKPVSDAPARCTTGGTRDCTGNHMASPPLWRADEKLADWERRRGKPRLQIFEKVLAGGPDKERMCGRVASQPYATNERRGSLGVKPRWAQCTSWANLNFKTPARRTPPDPSEAPRARRVASKRYVLAIISSKEGSKGQMKIRGQTLHEGTAAGTAQRPCCHGRDPSARASRAREDTCWRPCSTAAGPAAMLHLNSFEQSSVTS